MTSNRNTFFFVLTLLVFLTLKLSAQESGVIGPIDLSDPSNLTDGSYIIRSSGTYHFTGTYRGTPTADIDDLRKGVINVESNVGDVTIILENVHIQLSENYQCPVSVRNATGTATVQLKGVNELIAGNYCPALWGNQTFRGKLIVENYPGEEAVITAIGGSLSPGIGTISSGSCHLLINSGNITSTGGNYAAGIGGGGDCSGGTITIQGGQVYANGGFCAAGIGGGLAGGEITITGGIVNATGGDRAAGIGGGQESSGGKITIQGGMVVAQGGVYAAGIGGGESGSAGTITIQGGEVNAIGSSEKEAAGIGNGHHASGIGRITITGGNITAQGRVGIGSVAQLGKVTVIIIGGEVRAIGNSCDIEASGGALLVIGPDATVLNALNEAASCSYVNGLEFRDGSATVNGYPTLLVDICLDAGETLIIPENHTLTINRGVTLVNGGTIEIKNGAIIQNNGFIINSGTINGIERIKGNAPGTPELTDILLSLTEYTYNSEVQQPTVTVKAGEKILTANTDYEISYSGDCIHAGTYTITVAGKGYFTGTLTKTFTINQATNSWIDDLAVQGWGYGETENRPTATAKFGTPAFSYASSLDGDYTETVPATIGTWWVRASVEETTDYTGLEQKCSFTITKGIPPYVIPTNLSAIYGQTLADVMLPARWTWQADVTTPVGDVGTSTFQARYTPDDTENYQIVENVDISVVVQPKTLTAEMIQLSDDVFIDDGQHSQPTIAVQDGETVLIEGADYTVTWPEGGFSVPGRYAVTVTGQGNYQGEQTVWITKVNIKTVTATEELSALSDGYKLEIKSGGHAILKQGGITFESVTIEEGGQLTPDYADLNAGPATANSLIFKPTLENKWKAVGMPSIYTLLNSQDQEMNVSDKDAETGIWFAGLKNDAPEIEVKTQYANAGLWAANDRDTYTFKTNNSVTLQKAAEPTAPASGLQMFVNPNTFDITLTQSAYVLNEAGTVFELVENPTIRSFQSFVLADTNTTATLRSIGTSNSNVTANEFIVKAGYYLTSDRGAIVVHTAESMELYVVSVSGVMVYRGMVTDGQRIEVPTGFYVVNGQMVRVK